MKRILIFLLLPVFSFAQIDKKKAILLLGEAGAAAYYYADLPTPLPTQGDATLLNISMGSSITQAELGTGVRMGLVPTAGYANTLRASQLVGSFADPFIFKSESDATYSVVGGPTLPSGSNFLGQTGATISDYVTFNHLIALGNQSVASGTGFRWFGKAGGSNSTLIDIIIKSPQSPGIQFNGLASTNTGTYGSMRFEFVRVFGDGVDNEGFYMGETSVLDHGIVDSLFVFDCLVDSTGWDGFQANSVRNLHWNHLTATRTGISATSGQKSAVQLQNIGDNFLVENSVFQGTQAFQVAGRDGTFRNCTFIFEEAGLYQDMATIGYATPLSTIGGTVLFENCDFVYRGVGTLAAAIDLREEDADFDFVNCRISSNITALVDDNRGASSYTVTETGTESVSYYPVTYNNITYTDPDAGLITQVHYRSLGQGARNRIN